MRKVTRDIDEAVRDRVRALANTEAFQQSRRERKKVEMLFCAHEAHAEARPSEDKVLDGLKPFAGKGKVFHTSLSKDDEAALRKVLEGV